MKRKHLTKTPVYPRECLVIISYTTGLSFALERIGSLATIIIIVFYLFTLYLLVLPNTPENPFASIYSESLIKTTCQHLLLLVGFDTLIYRKYYDTPPILMGHHIAYLLYCIIIYFTSLAYHIYFYLHSHLVLDNHSVELGTQERGIVLQVAGRRTSGAFSTVP
jgi:hypothetical protein